MPGGTAQGVETAEATIGIWAFKKPRLCWDGPRVGWCSDNEQRCPTVSVPLLQPFIKL